MSLRNADPVQRRLPDDPIQMDAASTSYSPLKSFLANGHAAEFLLVLIVLYALQVLAPEFVVEDFIDLELAAQITVTSESNRFNQMFWVGCAAFGGLIWLNNRRVRFHSLVQTNPSLLMLILVMILSALWALDPGISFRRSVLQLMLVFCIVVGINGARSTKHCISALYIAMWISLIVHGAAILSPASYDWRGDFRGLYTDKNGLGSICVIGILLGIAIRGGIEGRIHQNINTVYLMGWLFIVMISGSKTSLGLAIIVPAIYVSFDLIAKSTRIGIGIYLIIALVLALSMSLFVVWGAGIRSADIVGLVSSDVTFTGRTTIWEFVLGTLTDHWMLGYGYQSYWNIGADAPNLKAPFNFVRLLNQAHNGYIDVVISLGLVGSVLTVAALVQGFATASRARSTEPLVHSACWLLIIFALLHNSMESTLLRGYHPAWLFLLISLVLAARAAHEARHR